MYETIETKCFNHRGIISIIMFHSLSLSHARSSSESSNICVQLSMTIMVITLPFQKEILTQIPFSLSNSNLLLSFV